MKKSLKAIIALMLVALFAVAMIPSAAAADKLTVKNESEVFSFELFKVATLDTANGKYTISGEVDQAVVDYINTTDTADNAGKTFLDKLDAATKVGTSVAVISGMNTDGYVASYDITEAGIYYAKVKDKPDGNIAKTKNSVIVWPEYNKTSKTWDYSFNSLDLGTKVGTDNITKKFSDTESDSKTAGQGDVIEFVLKADRVGNASDLATSYKIWDDMCPGLEYVAGSAHIFYDGTTTSADADFETFDGEKAKIETITANIVKYSNGTHFEFVASDAVLANAASNYYKADEIYVTYKAKVLNTAGIGSDYNPNKDGLKYKLTSGAEGDKEGREVKVYTFAAEANKIDATATAKAKAENPQAANVPLKGAVIGLYTKNATDNSLTEIARGTSGEDGKVTFKNGTDNNALRLAPGKYIVKEISAPAGFALSTVEYDLTVAADDAAHGTAGDGIFNLDNGKVVENFATKMPETGGQGTLMFTLIGAGLILCAGVLFIIVMKKKTAK